MAGLAGGAGGNPSFLARVSTVLAPELSCLAGGGRETGPTSCISSLFLSVILSFLPWLTCRGEEEIPGASSSVSSSSLEESRRELRSSTFHNCSYSTWSKFVSMNSTDTLRFQNFRIQRIHFDFSTSLFFLLCLPMIVTPSSSSPRRS